MDATRIEFNYSLRDANAPNNSNANNILINAGNLVSIQGMLKF